MYALAGYIALRAAMDARENVSPVLAALPVLGGLADRKCGLDRVARPLRLSRAVRLDDARDGVGRRARRDDRRRAVTPARDSPRRAAGDRSARCGHRIVCPQSVASRRLVGSQGSDRRSDCSRRRNRDQIAVPNGVRRLLRPAVSARRRLLPRPGCAQVRRLGRVSTVRIWLLIVTYVGYLLVLAGIQVWFAGQFTIPLAILDGFGASTCCLRST